MIGREEIFNDINYIRLVIVNLREEYFHIIV